MRASTSIRLAALLPLLLAASAHAQGADTRQAEGVYKLRARPAAAAVERVCPLLSAEGSVEIQDNGGTLVVRDAEPIVLRVLAALAEFDRPERTLRVAIQIVSADVGTTGVASEALELPAEIVTRLERLLRYRSYSLLARAEVDAPEEGVSSFPVGAEFQVSFRLDRGGEPHRVRMREFRVLRRTGHGDLKPLVHTHLSLEMGRPMILGLSPTEAADRALMLVLEAEGEAVEAL